MFKHNDGGKSRILSKEPQRESNEGGTKAEMQLGSVEEKGVGSNRHFISLSLLINFTKLIAVTQYPEGHIGNKWRNLI